MIDAYDILGIGLDADPEEVKKAFKRLSLQTHPDKVIASGSTAAEAGEKFNEIKEARAILEDVERRKIYDTFGIDLGEERPEMEVWTIGLGTLLSPLGSFTLKTACARAALWFIGFRWVGRILMLIGVVLAGLYSADFSFRDYKMRSEEAAPILVNIGILDGVLLIYWIWPLLAEAVGVFWLISEIVGVPALLDNWKVGAGVGVGSLVLARLFRGWWYWILGLEVVLVVVMLAALTVAAGIMRLWIDGVQAQRSEKVREWRLGLRKARKKLEDEVAELKKKLQEKDGQSSGGPEAMRRGGR